MCVGALELTGVWGVWKNGKKGGVRTMSVKVAGDGNEAHLRIWKNR